ncbi:MAG TPA: hypothetical protein VMS02_00360 [Solirubrobacteraceae bacterium]|nr:hypothetical protein [Solirubrobacteraceae bacterium]
MSRRSVLVVLAVGLAAIVASLIAVLSHNPLVAAGNNAIAGQHYVELEEEKHPMSTCQTAGVVPRGTTALRLGVEGLYYSPKLSLRMLSGSRVVREASHRGGGPPTPNVTVGVASFARSVQHARICVTVGPTLGAVRYYGESSAAATSSGDELAQAQLHVEYLRPGSQSWWSSIGSILRHIGYGRAPSGEGVALLALVLMLAVVVTVSRLTLRELR